MRSEIIGIIVGDFNISGAYSGGGYDSSHVTSACLYSLFWSLPCGNSFCSTGSLLFPVPKVDKPVGTLVILEKECLGAWFNIDIEYA